MSNYNGTSTSLLKFMGRKEFKYGFEDARAGKAWRNPEELPPYGDAVYERARHFAAACPQIEKIKEGRRVTEAAYYAFAKSYEEGEIL